MKVGTDGVLLGAWVDAPSSGHIWDVGTGTGLIALMLAQRCADARITAIEIDPAAAAQARQNIEASPWAHRIEVVTGDIRAVADTLPRPDLIVSNPPFFTNALLPPDGARSAARHDTTLPMRALIDIASQSLNPSGSLAMIIPADRADDAVTEAAMARLSPCRLTAVRTTPAKAPKRMLLRFTRSTTVSSSLISDDQFIQEAPGVYSQWYRNLTHDFYLH